MTIRKLFTTRSVILVALAAMVVLSFISYRTITKLNKLAALVDHTHVVQLNLQRTLSALSDADSELKAFLITRDSSYYTNLIATRKRVLTAIKTLTHLIQDNDLQAKRVTGLDSLINVRSRFMQAAMNMREGSYDYYSAQIEKCNNQLRQSIETLNAKEEELLMVRSNDSSEFQNTAPVTNLTFQVLIGLCLLVGFILVTADLKSKERLRLEALSKNKELKEQRDFIQSIFDNTVDVIIIFDPNRNIVALNKRARELYDREGDLVGKNVLEKFPAAEGSLVLQAVAEALQGKNSHTPAQESIVYKGKYFESSYVPLYSADQVLLGAMAIHHDVSEITKMTSELRATNDQLQKSNHELEQFAYVTSHDLQEPLRKIMTFVDLSIRKIENKEELFKNLKKISSSADRMSTLIRDILNYSRLTNPNSNKEEVDLNGVLEQVLFDFELIIEEKHAIIESTRLPKVFGSRQQLTQVFANIISNSLKFCTEAPRIAIENTHAEGRYEITFSDNGIGFEQTYAEQIFGVFQRLHQRTEFSGTGIGLALCKRIIENHGGLIRATSTPNRGTAIIVTLPDRGIEKKIIVTDLPEKKDSARNSLNFVP